MKGGMSQVFQSLEFTLVHSTLNAHMNVESLVQTITLGHG